VTGCAALDGTLQIAVNKTVFITGQTVPVLQSACLSGGFANVKVVDEQGGLTCAQARLSLSNEVLLIAQVFRPIGCIAAAIELSFASFLLIFAVFL